jgi:hypothetical protein
MVELYLHSLHVFMASCLIYYLSMGTTLPYCAFSCTRKAHFVGFEVLRVETTECVVFWVVMPGSLERV